MLESDGDLEGAEANADGSADCAAKANGFASMCCVLSNPDLLAFVLEFFEHNDWAACVLPGASPLSCGAPHDPMAHVKALMTLRQTCKTLAGFPSTCS